MSDSLLAQTKINVLAAIKKKGLVKWLNGMEWKRVAENCTVAIVYRP